MVVHPPLELYTEARDVVWRCVACVFGTIAESMATCKERRDEVSSVEGAIRVATCDSVAEVVAYEEGMSTRVEFN